MRHPDPEQLRRLETLDAPRRREILAHARDCAACRDELTRVDPSSLFAMLSLEPLPADALERLSARIDRDTSRQAAAPAKTWRWPAVAASLAVVAFLTIQISRRPAVEAPVSPISAASPSAEVQRLIEERAPLRKPSCSATSYANVFEPST